MAKDTVSEISALLQRLHQEREQHVAAIEQIDDALASLGINGGSTGATRRRGPGRPAGKKTSKKKRRGRGAGSRVQGVKAALESSLSNKPQSPAELTEKVSKKVGADVSVTTQLHMLKKEGKAKSVGRGQWVKA